MNHNIDPGQWFNKGAWSFSIFRKSFATSRGRAHGGWGLRTAQLKMLSPSRKYNSSISPFIFPYAASTLNMYNISWVLGTHEPFWRFHVSIFISTMAGWFFDPQGSDWNIPIHMAMDQYLLIPFLGEWTSINPSYFDVNYRGTRFWHTAIYIYIYQILSHTIFPWYPDYTTISPTFPASPRRCRRSRGWKEAVISTWTHCSLRVIFCSWNKNGLINGMLSNKTMVDFWIARCQLGFKGNPRKYIWRKTYIYIYVYLAGCDGKIFQRKVIHMIHQAAA